MEETVSIIVPVYNAAPYLERCVDSLLRQTYRNTEILLLDDGSADGSGQICDRYARCHENVKVFHMPNAGVSAARNRGLQECGGKYLTFVDADDVPAGDMVEYLVGMAEKTGCDVAGCGYFEFGENGRECTEGIGGQIEGGKEEWDVERLSGSEFVERGILRSDTRCWSKLYRRESVGMLRFDTGLTIGEDMLFLLELAMQGKGFCRGNYKGYGYFVNEAGAMRRGFKDSYMDQIVCWQKALERIGKLGVGRLTERTEAILLISVMLVVGKLAQLPGKEMREKAEAGEYCLALVREYGRKRGVFRELDGGYRIKVRVFGCAPKVYMVLYHVFRGGIC